MINAPFGALLADGRWCRTVCDALSAGAWVMPEVKDQSEPAEFFSEDSRKSKSSGDICPDFCQDCAALATDAANRWCLQAGF